MRMVPIAVTPDGTYNAGMDQAALRAWRARLALSQPAAARALGVPIGTYRGWEQGCSPPLHPTLLRLACERIAAMAAAAPPPPAPEDAP